MDGEDISQGALYFAARKYADSEKMRWFDEKLQFLFQHGGHEFLVTVLRPLRIFRHVTAVNFPTVIAPHEKLCYNNHIYPWCIKGKSKTSRYGRKKHGSII